MSELPETLPHTWRQRAEQLRDWGATSEAARMWERAASELEQALLRTGGEALTLTEAAGVSGLTASYLGDLVRAGKLPNAGRKYAPRVRRADLPTTRRRPETLQKRHRSQLKLAEIAKRLR